MPVTTGARPDGAPAEDRARAVNPYAADEHALIITDNRAFLPSQVELPLVDPIDSVERLEEVITKALDPKRKRKMLRPKGVTAQVWIVGSDQCDRMGWLPPEPDGWDEMPDLQRRVALAGVLAKQLPGTLWPFTDAGWELRADPGHRILLTRGRAMVDIVLEPMAWLAMGSDKGNILGTEPDDPTDQTATAPSDDDAGDPLSTALPDDDIGAAKELGRRLAACVQHLGVLPSESAGRTGASIADAIWNARTRGVVITEPGPLPILEGGPSADDEDDLEPPLEFNRDPGTIDLDELELTVGDTKKPITHLVEVDQRASYLGSTGIELGYGTPVHLSGEAAGQEIRKAWNAPKTKPLPFGLYRVWLPAGEELAYPDWLPLPHPHMRKDRRVQTWVTSVSVEWLCKPIIDGGAGLDLADLEIEQAWLWPSQGRCLDAWTKVLREARQYFVDTGDIAMADLVKAVYQQYVGRMKTPKMWTSKRKRHHHQPVWRAAIMANARWRARAQAMRFYDQFGLKPLQSVVDAHIYAIGPGPDGTLPDLEDHTNRLGQPRIKSGVEVNEIAYEHFVLGIAAARRPRDVAKTLAAIFKYGKTQTAYAPELAYLAEQGSNPRIVFTDQLPVTDGRHMAIEADLGDDLYLVATSLADGLAIPRAAMTGWTVRIWRGVDEECVARADHPDDLAAAVEAARDSQRRSARRAPRRAKS